MNESNESEVISMKKKIMAMLAAISMLAGMTAFPVSAETEAVPSLWDCKHFLVVDADQDLVVQLLETDVVDNYAAYYDLVGYKITYYGIGMGTIGCGSSQSTWEGKEELENGDILIIDGITCIEEVYPGCIHFDENSVITNLGQTEEIAERKPLVWIRNTALADAEGNVYYYDDSGFDFTGTSIMDQFELGDTVDFWVYGNRAVSPIGASEVTLFAPEEYVVVDQYAYGEQQCYVIMDKSGYTYYYTEEQMAAGLLTGEKMPKYGDVITIQASYYEQTEKWGTNWLTKEFQSGIPALIRNVGNVFENGTTEMFTVTTENHNTSVWLTNAAGKKTTFFLDYLPEDSVFFSLKDGDQVMMYTNQGMPVIATEQAPLVLGDVNADGTLSIADVLALNRNLLAGDPLPALQNARSTELGYLDFDGDGTLTQADVLGMLKRVLGIG